MLVKQNPLKSRGCLVKLVVAILPLFRFPLYSVLTRTQDAGGAVT